MLIHLYPADNRITVKPLEAYQPGAKYNLRVLISNLDRYKMYFNTAGITQSYLPQTYHFFNGSAGNLCEFKQLSSPEDNTKARASCEVITVRPLISTSKPLATKEDGAYTLSLENSYPFIRSENPALHSVVAETAPKGSWTDIPPPGDVVPLEKSWLVSFNRGFKIEDIDAMVIKRESSFIPVSISLLTDKRQAVVTPAGSYRPDEEYHLKIFLNNLNRYQMSYYTGAE